MKNYFFTLVISVMGLQLSFAQIVDIPDPAFKNYLITANCVNLDGDNDYDADADTNNDGEIQVTEAQAVLDLLITGSAITSIEGIASFSNLIKTNIFATSITSLDASILPGLVELRCSSTPGLTTINLSGLGNLNTLYLRDVGISEVDLSSLTNAEDITIFDTPLLTIDLSNLSNLESVNCMGSVVENLITDGCTSLKNILSFDSNISSLDLSTNTNLEVLRAYNCNLTNLDLSGLEALTDVRVYGNSLTAIQFGDNNALVHVNVRNNELTSLDLTSLTAVVTVEATNNLLSSIHIGTGLDALFILGLSNNALTSLDISNLDALSSLRLSDNELTFLNLANLPSLSTLLVGSNNLTDLDVTEVPSLANLNCQNNLFSFLDFTNQVFSMYVNCDDNPNLESLYFKNGQNDFLGVPEESTSFENCPNINFICVDSFEETKVQQLIADYGYADVTLSTLCPDTPGNTAYEIIGIARYSEAGGTCDTSDVPVGNLQYTINNGTSESTFFSGNSGSFSIPLNEGDYTVTPIAPVASYFFIDPMNFTASFPTDASPFEQNICFTPNGSHTDIEVFIVPVGIARPGEEAFYSITVSNVGTETTTGDITLMYDEAVSNLVASNPAVSSQNTNELIWQYIDLNPFETQEIEFSLLINEPGDTPPVIAGTLLSYTVTVTPLEDENPDSNVNSLVQTVVNSFDPNNKICLQGNAIEIDAVGDDLFYQINFENMGTADALNVYVKDFIDTNYFDMETFQPLGGSHEYSTNVVDNLVEFQFIDINLPFETPNNTGHLVFKIKTKATLGIGDIIKNGAEIIFDFNEPIITNIAATEITEILTIGTSDKPPAITLFPNPTTTLIKLQGATTELYYSICNSIGQVVAKGIYTDEGISVAGLNAGLYFINVADNNSNETLRFIKR
jgi:hypothetical protein